MYRKFKENVYKYKLIERGSTVLAAVSGGYDSMSLVNLLYTLKKDLDFDLIVLHVNHGLREEASQDEAFVKAYCQERGLKFFVKHGDMRVMAKEEGLSEEEAGRKLRYDYFYQMACKFPDARIALGHNRSDQVETVLMNIIRGSGLKGLAGMDFKRDKLIRPILSFTREEIEAYVEKEGIGHCDDKTNFESDYRRNSLRNELIPLIEDKYNPNFKEAIYKLSELARLDMEIIERLTSSEIEAIGEEIKDGYLLDKIAFNQLAYPVKAHILRDLAARIKGSAEGLEKDHIDEFIQTATRPTGRKTEIKGLSLKVEYGKLSFTKAGKTALKPIETGIKNTMLNYGNYRISLKQVEPGEKIRPGKYTQYFKADELKSIRIRPREKGDRIKPFGMEGSKKLKDIFIDKKVPARLRDGVPVITDGREIIWLAPYRRSRLYKLDEKTKKILRIRIEELDGNK